MDTRFIFHTIDQLCKFIEASGYRGYDPYDALSSPFLLWVARRNPSAGRFLISAFRFSPFNLRSFFSIRPEADAKAIALMARGYFLLGDILKNEKYWALGTECLKILEKISISGFSGMCWAHPFSYCSRRGFIPANFPTVISTVYAAQAFLDGYERVGEKQWLKVARSACNFILKDLSRVSSPTSFFFTYYPGSNLPVHNANLLAVELFVRVACLRDEKSLLESALSALDYTLSDQKVCTGKLMEHS